MQRPKGTKDIFGNIQDVRQYVLDVIREISLLYNFKKIDTPIFESKEVFTRSVGESSDIVSKEMYEFKDKGDRDLVLRPEGTAGAIRAIVENKLYANPLPLKIYYEGPMFRYENPQKGRQRQFTQFGAELIADKSPLLDAEIILYASSILDALNLDYVLKINSLGSNDTRKKWSNALKKYFNKYIDKLSSDSLKRLEKNPMRILDDKIDGKKDFVKNAPKIEEFYDSETREYFDAVTNFLNEMDIKFVIDQNLVRGLDYYTDTAFEFVSKSSNSGSQSTLIGGGRYEDLLNKFGGPNISGIGFGMGIERIVNDLIERDDFSDISILPEVYVINLSQETSNSCLSIVYMLRQHGILTEWNYKPTKIQKAFEKAEASGAKIYVILGPKDLKDNSVNIKYNGRQENVKLDNLINYIENIIGEIYEEN